MRPEITDKRDSSNVRKIHAYLQLRIAFRKLYPSDQPRPIEKNQRTYEQALKATPEQREAMARQIDRKLLKQGLLIGSLLLLLRFLF